MSDLLERYAEIVGEEQIAALTQIASHLRGVRMLHVNSTKEGGGVAEILHKMIPLLNALGIEAEWEVVEGNPLFYQCTKTFHNGLQGNTVSLNEAMLDSYREVNEANADRLADRLRESEFVIIHDPQPAAMIQHTPERQGKWFWRCHIDASMPYRPVWRYLRRIVNHYDASIFSLPEFAQPLNHPQYLVTPSIDPLSEKNMVLPDAEVAGVREEFDLDPELPLILQVSRFDRFKDPIGVIEACRIARRIVPLQLVLAGGGADDDPEGQVVLDEVQRAVAGDPFIHVLLLPPDAHRTINALQRAADVVLQKSIREGFGLTVTEAMWKSKPVIGGDTGGIRLQVFNHHTGFLVRTPEGAALRIRYLLSRPDRVELMGRKAHDFVLNHYLITRHAQNYLALMLRATREGGERIEL